MVTPTTHLAGGADTVLAPVGDVLVTHVDDGLVYAGPDGISHVTGGEEECSGMRANLIGRLSLTRIPCHVDRSWCLQ